MSQNFSHETYRDTEPTKAGSDRAFGCTVGTVLLAIGATKTFVAGAVTTPAFLIFAAGAMLLCLGIGAPSRLSALNRLWSKIAVIFSKVVNPIVLALLFFLVVTPMALIMRLTGKRPLRLAPDRTAPSYWIAREAPSGETSSMKRQF